MRWERNGVPCLPYVEHRTRDGRESGDVWGWSETPGDAFLFLAKAIPAVRSGDDYSRSAEFHIAELKRENPKLRAWACDWNVPGAQERALRHASTLAAVEGSVRDLTEKPLLGPPRAKSRARRRAPRRRSLRPPVEPAEVFEMNERRRLA